jgi:hypothetical protein
MRNQEPRSPNGIRRLPAVKRTVHPHAKTAHREKTARHSVRTTVRATQNRPSAVRVRLDPMGRRKGVKAVIRGRGTRVTADRVTADRVTADRVTADRVTADRVTADRVTDVMGGNGLLPRGTGRHGRGESSVHPWMAAVRDVPRTRGMRIP